MDKRLHDVLGETTGNYILPFLWMHGEEEALLVRELDAVYRSGIRAVCLESRPHEDFAGDGWWRDVDILMREAKKRGMAVWVLDDKRFPTGYANGLIEKKYPERRKWHLMEQHVDVTGPARGALLLDSDGNRDPANERTLVAALACLRTAYGEELEGTVVDVTDRVHGDFLYWDVPAGCWRVFTLYKTREGAFNSAYIHMIDEQSVDVLIEAVYEPHYRRYGDEFGKTFAGFFSDEPFFGNQPTAPAGGGLSYYLNIGTPYLALPWRDDMPSRLSGRLGRDVLPLLPALWFELGGDTAAVRVAYMDIVSGLYRDCFTHRLGEWCRARGAQYIGHVIEDQDATPHLGYGAGHYYRSQTGQDMAGLDVVLHQIMPGFSRHRHTAALAADGADTAFFDYAMTKMASSLAHWQPRMKGRAVCEIFGAYGWAEGAPVMKWLLDHMLVRGVNHFVPHAFSPQFPDPDCPPHFYADGRNPQFRDFGALMRYVNRMCHLLGEGAPVVSAGVLYHAEAEWSGGDFMPCSAVARPLYDSQLDYAILPIDSLQEGGMTPGGRLVVGDFSLPCLVVPYAQVLPQAALDRLGELAAAGLDVIFIQDYPQRSEQGLAFAPSAGMRVCGDAAKLPALLEAAGYRDLGPDAPFALLRAYHVVRAGELPDGDTHLVMLFNEDMQPFEGRVRLPFTGGALRLDLLNGGRHAVDIPSSGLPLVLEPYESCVIVAGGGADGAGAPAPVRGARVRTVLLDRFDITVADMDAAAEFRPYRTGAAPHDITGPGALPDFSGTIRYECVFAAGEGQSAQLKLGCVGETARVWVNGTDCGSRLCRPYSLDITAAVRPGDNTLRVEVANSMAYRLKDGLSRWMLLPASGLLGPVEIEYYG